MMKPYFAYILKCADGTFYTGITTDLERRLRQHNGEIVGGARYTAARQPVKLLTVSVPLESRSAASKLEYQVKLKRKAEKIAFLNSYTIS
ncbi:MAG: GIY-YIG nuclease family protein [Lentisphaerales bacterium]|nr:GIY-YIG nuclease family protein [Lentisphaerales bacterium]